MRGITCRRLLRSHPILSSDGQPLAVPRSRHGRAGNQRAALMTVRRVILERFPQALSGDKRLASLD